MAKSVDQIEQGDATCPCANPVRQFIAPTRCPFPTRSDHVSGPRGRVHTPWRTP